MLKQSTILRLRRSQSAADNVWNELMTARDNECEGNRYVATNEDIAMLALAAVKMNQAVHLIEQLRYKHDADYKRKA